MNKRAWSVSICLSSCGQRISSRTVEPSHGDVDPAKTGVAVLALRIDQHLGTRFSVVMPLN
jgi:hypothetical protein